MLDLSASIQYKMIVNFVRETIYNLDVSFNRVRVGVVTYHTTVHVQFHLNTFRGREEILNAVEGFDAGGKTNTYGALQACREQIFTDSSGDRTGVPNIAILVSDGDSNIDSHKTQEAAEELRNAQAEIFAVGVGPNPRIGKINGIASDPDNTHVFYMKDSSEVVRAADKLTEELCQ